MCELDFLSPHTIAPDQTKIAVDEVIICSSQGKINGCFYPHSGLLIDIRGESRTYVRMLNSIALVFSQCLFFCKYISQALFVGFRLI